MKKYLAVYKELHEKKRYGTSSERMFRKFASCIPRDITSLLDYGSGQSTLASIIKKERQHIKEADSYDPAVKGRDKFPEKEYDFVTCTDMLEHVPEEELAETLDKLYTVADRGFFMIACSEAREVLPNGENAHCLVKPPKWWKEKIEEKWEITGTCQPLHSGNRIAWTVKRKAS